MLNHRIYIINNNSSYISGINNSIRGSTQKVNRTRQDLNITNQMNDYDHNNNNNNITMISTIANDSTVSTHLPTPSLLLSVLRTGCRPLLPILLRTVSMLLHPNVLRTGCMLLLLARLTTTVDHQVNTFLTMLEVDRIAVLITLTR